MSGFKSACRLRMNAARDWQLVPPPGQIARIGDAGVALFAADEDDLFVSGDLEVRESLYVTGESGNALQAFEIFVMAGAYMHLLEDFHGALAYFCIATEEITIPVGQGAAGVWGAACLNPGDSIILGVVSRVTQAPGGGATMWLMGRSSNIDEWLANGPVALGTTSNSAVDGDGVNVGPIYNDTDRVMKVSTDSDVTISDMKVRITTYYINFYAPDD